MNRMVEVKTSELIGAALDWAVGKAQGWVVYPTDSIEQGDTWHLDTERAPFGQIMRVADWQPSTRWAQCGPLIEKYKVWLTPPTDCEPVGWDADVYDEDGGEGSGVRRIYGAPTALVAACRSIVAAKCGSVVSVPAGLCNVHPK